MALAAVLHKIVSGLLLLSVFCAMTTAPQDLKKMGKVYIVDGGFRADLQLRDASGLNKHIRGPRRGGQKRAFEDLLSIRASATEHTTRMGALQARR